MRRPSFAILAALSVGAALLGSVGADAEPLSLRVHSSDRPLFMQHAWHLAGNPNVTPSNPMGVVGWNGPPDDVPSVSADAGAGPPASITNAPFEGYGLY